MDLGAELRTKIERLSLHHDVAGLRAALRHIEVAERHLDRGRKDREDDLFNDVVYRTNQAFEGMLKEAYAVFAKAEVGKMPAHKIEQALADDKKLYGRFAKAITRYREEWRNASTHDHRLLFSEQEALLAIVNVSAFAALLLDQIVETVISRQPHPEIDFGPSFDSTFWKYKERPFIEQISVLLVTFARGNHPKIFSESEAEMLGLLASVLRTLDLELGVEARPIVKNREPDFVLRKRDDVALVEVKRSSSISYVRAAVDQVKHMLLDTDIRLGFVLVVPRSPGQIINTRLISQAPGDPKVVVIAPAETGG
jgi:hypothetical protein